MTSKKIFNPLFSQRETVPVATAAAASDSKGIMSTSAIFNEQVGVCPKCKNSMMTGAIANSDTVYFCPTCRVSEPLADS